MNLCGSVLTNYDFFCYFFQRGRVSFDKTMVNDTFTTSTMTIHDVKMTDFRIFTCKANNSQGYDETRIKITGNFILNSYLFALILLSPNHTF